MYSMWYLRQQRHTRAQAYYSIRRYGGENNNKPYIHSQKSSDDDEDACAPANKIYNISKGINMRARARTPIQPHSRQHEFGSLCACINRNLPAGECLRIDSKTMKEKCAKRE